MVYKAYIFLDIKIFVTAGQIPSSRHAQKARNVQKNLKNGIFQLLMLYITQINPKIALAKVFAPMPSTLSYL